MKFADGRAGNILKKSFRYLTQFLIIGYLIYQLFTIGFHQIIASLPSQPFFYILYFIIYFSLPVAEVLIYRIKWPVTFRNSMPVFIQKKVLNTDVLGYSGEIYLYQWAKTKLGKSTKEALNFIKDNNILSSIASTLISLLLLFFFITQGYININDYIGSLSTTNWLFIGILIIIACGLVYRFRKSIISMSRATSLKIFSLHASRIVFINILQILQWKVGKPEIAYSVWFTFSAVQILSSRIPFLPSTDALFVNVALEMSEMVSVPKEALVGLLAANLVLKRVLNLVSYFVSSYLKKRDAEIISTNNI